MNKDQLEWQEVNTEHIVRDEWIDFRKTDWRFPDGNVVGPFYSYTRKDYVVIVASDTEGNYICVRQFRQGIRKVTTEFPAGAIERKDGSRNDDSPITEADALTAAKRELLEETGYESDDWKHLITLPSNATMADNYAFIFKAENCRKVAGQDLDETEFISIEELPAQKIDEMIETGEFPQAVHIVAWLKSRG